ncbi:MAG TPA: class I SAM-dependent methyltransferase [Solirubrobacteraceae bacterium]|nr:class I SAM-dependent methyltransferase [Solirubrobacteraceae bacterium]
MADGGWMERRRTAFGPIADLYEEARPSYPPALVADVLAYAGAGEGDRLLEIGAGTGKATRLFAAGGLQVVALEPSPAMAEVARRECAELANVTLIESTFEAWRAPPGAFRLVMAAQAWHWVDPAVGYARARVALGAGGALALFWNRADWRPGALTAALDAIYAPLAGTASASGPVTTAPAGRAGDEGWAEEIGAAGAFAEPEVRDYPWSRRYSAGEYARLLATHSDHAVLDAQVRARLLARVEEAIAGAGGTIEIAYVTRLCLARAS